MPASMPMASPLTAQRPSLQSLHLALEDKTLDLFERAFTVPKDRPTAGEWRRH